MPRPIPPPAVALEPHYTPEEMAELLRVTTRTLGRWRDQRIGPPYVKIGRKVRYPQSGAVRYLAQQTHGGDEGPASNLIPFPERKRRG